jgi:hypothetical protein
MSGNSQAQLLIVSHCFAYAEVDIKWRTCIASWLAGY